MFLSSRVIEAQESVTLKMNNKINCGNNPIAGAVLNKVRVVYKDNLNDKK